MSYEQGKATSSFSEETTGIQIIADRSVRSEVVVPFVIEPNGRSMG
jgi:hypothetical protein